MCTTFVFRKVLTPPFLCTHTPHTRVCVSDCVQQFCKTQPKSGVEEEARIKAELERKKRANAQITLMDPKTSQNVGIALAKIRLSNEKVQQDQASLLFSGLLWHIRSCVAGDTLMLRFLGCGRGAGAGPAGEEGGVSTCGVHRTFAVVGVLVRTASVNAWYLNVGICVGVWVFW